MKRSRPGTSEQHAAGTSAAAGMGAHDRQQLAASLETHPRHGRSRSRSAAAGINPDSGSEGAGGVTHDRFAALQVRNELVQVDLDAAM